MDKETKDEALHMKEPGEAEDPGAEPTQDEEPTAQHGEHNNSLAQKRGRIMVAGGLTAVLLSVVAVIVAGIFGLTTHWLKICPTDLPVNDPARQLSQQLISEKVEPQPLGVSKKIAEQTRLKGVESH